MCSARPWAANYRSRSRDPDPATRSRRRAAFPSPRHRNGPRHWSSRGACWQNTAPLGAHLPTVELVLRLLAEVLGLGFGLVGFAFALQPFVAGSVACRLLPPALGALYVGLGSVL